MSSGVAIPEADIPAHLLGRSTRAWVYERAGRREVRFLHRHAEPLLPVWWDGGLRLLRWGNRRRDRGSRLPGGGWAWRGTLDAGGWAPWRPEPAEVRCDYALERGVWQPVKRGLTALVAADRDGEPVAYLLCQPATRYYEVMTGSARMPVPWDPAEWQPGG